MTISTQFQDMISELLPTQSEQEAFFQAFQQPLKKSISIMRQRSEDFENKNPDFILTPTPFHEHHDTKYIDREDITIPLGKTWQHLTGQFYIQEVAASLPANILKGHLKGLGTRNNEPLKILDTCAAPGGKTAQTADSLLSNTIPGIVRGNDVDTGRLASRSNNIQRCGLYNTVATKMDASQIGKFFPEFFDAILVDAPCSGEGTGFKSSDAFRRRKEESINKIVGLQSSIIDSALQACKIGGIIVYSTCTLNPFENEGQILRIQKLYGDAIEILPIDVENKSEGVAFSSETLDPSHLQLGTKNFLRARPHVQHTGGFFVCLMKKTKSITNSPTRQLANSPTRQLPYSYHKQEENMVCNLLKQSFGIKINLDRYAIITSKHGYHLTDASVRELVTQGLRFHECGLPLLKTTGKTHSPTHECGLALGHLATHNILELTSDELQRYCLGEDIVPSKKICNEVSLQKSGLRGQVNNYLILTHAGQGVGVGKIVNGILKNKFFKW